MHAISKRWQAPSLNIGSLLIYKGKQELGVRQTNEFWQSRLLTVALVGCGQEEPEELKPKLEAWLQSNGIPYEYTATSKFANFHNRTLI